MSALYTPRLLSLAAELAQYPLHDGLPLRAELRSRTCGSAINLGLDLDADGYVSGIGMMVTACAIGQSSAAVFASAGTGREAEEIASVLTGLENWLDGTGALPDWPGLDALEPALPHPGRHPALLLPWRAAVKALSKDPLAKDPLAKDPLSTGPLSSSDGPR